METWSLMKAPWIALPIIYAFIPHIRHRCNSTIWNLGRIQSHVVPSPSARALPDFSDTSTWKVLFAITLRTNTDSDEVSQKVLFSLLKFKSCLGLSEASNIYPAPAHCAFSSQRYFWGEILVELPWKLFFLDQSILTKKGDGVPTTQRWYLRSTSWAKSIEWLQLQ